MKKFTPILISIVGLTVAYYAGVAYRKWQDARELRAQTEATKDLVILYDFMGMDQFPIIGRVLESRTGYVRVAQPDGRVYEHSGRYSVIKR